MSRQLTVVLFACVALLASACSGSVEFSFGEQTPGEAAVDLIEGDAMAQRLGIGAISSASCDEPASRDVGETFPCTALSGGDTVMFEVTMEEADRIFAAPRNVVAAEFLDDYAASAAQALSTETGLELPGDSVDCGDQSVVLDENDQMMCVITDPATGVLYEAPMTVNDTTLATFSVEIGPAIE